jgi:hypothetical protein
LPFLAECAESVRAAKAAVLSPWSIRWVVVFNTDEQADDPGADLVLRSPRAAGAAVSRNRVLPYLDDLGGGLDSTWVYPLDADDAVDADELSALLCDSVFLHDSRYEWIASSRVLLGDVGSDITTVYTFDAARTYQQWELMDQWESPGYFHSNSVMVRAELLLAVGGWPAMAGHEDVALSALLADSGPGAALPYHVTRYRLWDGQTIRQPWLTEQRNENMIRIAASANARRRRTGRRDLVAVPPAIERDSHGLPLRKSPTARDM